MDTLLHDEFIKVIKQATGLPDGAFYLFRLHLLTAAQRRDLKPSTRFAVALTIDNDILNRPFKEYGHAINRNSDLIIDVLAFADAPRPLVALTKKIQKALYDLSQTLPGDIGAHRVEGLREMASSFVYNSEGRPTANLVYDVLTPLAAF